MKNYLILLQLLLSLAVAPLLQASQPDIEQRPLTLRGQIIAGDTQQPLINATITAESFNISSVTNQEGKFVLRLPIAAQEAEVTVRHLGYENRTLAVSTLLQSSQEIILQPSTITLGTLEVVKGDGTQLVRDALQRIPYNYPAEPEMMVAFYRESIKKGSNHISLVEAVLDIYKSSYRSYSDDQAKIYIGRKATDVSPRDTLLLKFQGGISTALMLDVAKYPDILLGEKGEDYAFAIEGMVHINNKPHYAIQFKPLPGIEDILFRGTIYLDAATLAFARVEFNMNVEGRKDAASVFIRRRPSKMRADIEEARYIIDFAEHDGKWHFNYSNTEVRFRIRWTNRLFGLFSTVYTISSEMAMTDRYDEGITRFPRKERIRSSDVIAEKVEHFTDPDFWGDYNVIEPDIEISRAIKRLSGRLSRRNQ